MRDVNLTTFINLSHTVISILRSLISRLRRMSGNSFVDCDPFSETPMQSESIGDIQGILAEGNGIEDKEADEPRWAEADEPQWAEALTPEKVRWFFKDGVHKRWVEFCGYDSLRIENVWRSREAAKDKEKSENALPLESVVVRGGMYDVELNNMRCVSIYWPGEEWEIMRGTWFYDGSWIPIDTEDAKVLEEVHLRLFEKPSPTPPSSTTPDELPVSAQTSRVLHTQHFPDFHVDWHAINDVTRYSEYKHSKLMRSVTSKLGFTKTTGYRLRRGYMLRATMDDKPHDIDHLVFVVHGIGQKGDTGKIIRNTTSFRECVGWLERKYFPNSEHRVEFFPVEWRSSLKLDGDIVDAITPYSVPGIRQLLNTSAMDILYYTSPLYGGEVRTGLQKELNRLYSKFSSRHPGWTGKVSILAHSLGCVIVYDIVTGWMGPDTRPPSPAAPDIPDEGLQFTIENLFCLGSPLSVFLALRTRTPTTRLDVMPKGLCKRFYNIFHWSDPVAYRMEPLLERGYSKIDPVLILPYGGVDSQVIEPPPTIASGEQAISSPDNEEVERDETSPGDTPNRNVDKGWSLWGLVRAGWTAKEGSSPTPDANPLRPDQELTERLDYVLRAGGLGRNYLYTVTAHTAYWNNYDVAYFVLTRLFPTLDT